MNDALIQQLFALQDKRYQEFHSRLMPNIPKNRIIGIRMPALRKFAKAFGKMPEAAAFLADLPHFYYEENNLHACLVANMKDFNQCMAATNAFLPHLDNWATCDMFSPKIFGQHLPELLAQIRFWLADSRPYILRFGVGMLMRFFLGDAFSSEFPALVAALPAEEYYVHMMIAWYFATALAKQPAAVLPFLENHCLDVKTHNKAIQKAMESNRISPAQKAYIRQLRRKS